MEPIVPNHPTIFDNLSLPAVLFSARGDMLMGNLPARRIFPVRKSGKQDRPPVPWMHDDVLGFLAAGERNVPLKRSFKPAGKQPLRFSVNLSRIHRDHGLPLVIAVCTDITKRIRYQEKISRLAAIIDSADDAMASMTLEKRGLCTAGHQHKVARISQALVHKPGLDAIHTAGVLHDIGKICIPMTILIKPARLSRALRDL